MPGCINTALASSGRSADGAVFALADFFATTVRFDDAVFFPPFDFGVATIEPDDLDLVFAVPAGRFTAFLGAVAFDLAFALELVEDFAAGFLLPLDSATVFDLDCVFLALLGVGFGLAVPLDADFLAAPREAATLETAFLDFDRDAAPLDADLRAPLRLADLVFFLVAFFATPAPIESGSP